ncbi:MFS transporter [Silvania hatchlandensis]|uniref:Glycoside-pentoside-hexuronide (GPH):cation symporter n=1 Tax=Silvania hatchlandensis TaxID=2926469 RepID=A0A9J6Q6U8_9ENTR|nr:glycoside-pentoside-hexuronide (GPH):cation symporter [Silvania hatchlandensis]MCU6665939.1 glycoside-pentoside-hexuronide (GPH):cation symporter [Silvania hatchlandensis]
MKSAAITPVSFREKVCYGLGDTSANIFMGMTMMFLSIYYTDVFKLSPAAMGTLFLITRLIDAISDPIIGSLSDRTRSRLGRYRPWLLWFAIPYGLSCAAVFFSPELGETGRTLYAYITYIILVLSFSLVVVPYVSLLGAISADSGERIQINAIRFPLAKVSYLICSLLVPALIALFDNDVVGYRVVMCGIGILSTVLVLICYFNTTERVLPDNSDALSLKQQVKYVFKNDQAMIVFAAQTVVMVMNTLKFGAAAYFVKYVLSMPTSFLSLLLTAGSIAGILAPLLTGYFLKKGWVKRIPLLVGSQIVGGMITLAIGLTPVSAIWFHALLFVLATLAVELIAVIIWATVADVADYGFHRFGVRINGMIGGGMLFATKAGMAIGGAIIGYVLAWFGYNPDTMSSASENQLSAFMLLYAWLPAVCMFMAAALFSRYKLDEKACQTFIQDSEHSTSGVGYEKAAH